ncbi:hypothetical protein MBLNU457_5428t1 [Dothideomycetes sp. NU457]
MGQPWRSRQPHLMRCAQKPVTRGSRGIGHAIASTFADLGASCTLVGRNSSTLETATSSLANPFSGDHTYITGDISSADFWSKLSLPYKSSSDHGPSKRPRDRRIDVLINAAGVTHSSLLLRTTETQINEVIQTNLMGTLWASRAIGKKMLRQAADEGSGEKGCIINISSLLAVHSGIGAAAYAASKAGVGGLTRALAAELGGSGIRVNAVLPGYVQTDMTDAMTEEAREKARNRIPLKRLGTPSEVADATVFLAANAYANNCILNLDGGLSAT